MRVKVLVIPVLKRHWLFHAWSEGAAETGAGADVPWWQAGRSLGDKASALGATVNARLSASVSEQWAAVETAREGTFRHWLYRLALAVLAREDPTESFLKKVPGGASSVEVVYPASLDETLVRRRLRLLALRNAQVHQRGLLGWTLASVPQLPLAITPLPNVTIYYSVYRAVSHYRAVGGSRTLKDALANPTSMRLQRALTEGGRTNATSGGGARRRLDDARTQELVAKLLQQYTASPTSALPQGTGHGCPATGKGGQQGAGCAPQLQRGDSAGGGGSSSSNNSGRSRRSTAAPVVVFVPSMLLDDVVQPLERWTTPLEEGCVGQLAGRFNTSGMAEHLARVRRAAVAAEEQAAAARASASRHSTPEEEPQRRFPPPPAVPATHASDGSGENGLRKAVGGGIWGTVGVMLGVAAGLQLFGS